MLRSDLDREEAEGVSHDPSIREVEFVIYIHDAYSAFPPPLQKV